jgi:hypothetical protein
MEHDGTTRVTVRRTHDGTTDDVIDRTMKTRWHNAMKGGDDDPIADSTG